jgi:hypothetical protein
MKDPALVRRSKAGTQLARCRWLSPRETG